MYKAFYQDSSLVAYPLFALIFFVVFFSIVLVNVLRRRPSDGLDSISRMPLDDNEGINHGR